MTLSTIELQQRNHGKWHVKQSNCTDGFPVTDRLELDPSNVKVTVDDGGAYRVTTDDELHKSMMCSACATTVQHGTFRTTGETYQTRTQELTYRGAPSAGTSPDSVLPDLGKELSPIPENSATPIITTPDAKTQITASEIDRRPLIFIDERRKYADVTLTVAPTRYQLTRTGVSTLIDALTEHENEAVETGDQQKDITVYVSTGDLPDVPSRHQQTIVVKDILIDQAHALATTWSTILSEQDLLTAYENSFPDDSTPGDLFQVPRPGAPEPEPSDELNGTAQHVSLTDKQPDIDALSEYISANAMRVARHINHEFTTTVDSTEHAVHGTDEINNHSVTVWFNGREPDHHECDCTTPFDPCEHVAAVFKNLPSTSALYSKSSAE